MSDSIPSYAPQFSASMTKSLEGLDLDGEPTEVKKSVRIVLLLLDILIHNFPRRRQTRGPERLCASQLNFEKSIDHLSTAPENLTIWLAETSFDYDAPQFLPPLNAPETVAQSVVDMGLYAWLCDIVTYIGDEMLQSLIGTDWAVSRIFVRPDWKHIYVGHSGTPPDFDFEANICHVVIGIFDLAEYCQSTTDRKPPQYIIDPTILQYQEPNSRRFSTWEQYQTFLVRFPSSGRWWRGAEAGDDAADEREVDGHEYWGPALALIRGWRDNGIFDIDRITDAKLELMMTDFEEIMPPHASEFAWGDMESDKKKHESAKADRDCSKALKDAEI